MPGYATKAWFMLLCLGAALSAAPALARQPCTAHPGGDWMLVRAMLLLPSGPPRQGAVLVDPQGIIACAGARCGARSRAATVIDCRDAVLSPGFINLHEHLAFGNVAPSPDSGIRYTHRHDWRKGLNGFQALENFRQTSDPGLLAWFELRHLLAGETAIVGGAMAPGLVRNLDSDAGLEGLDTPRVTYETFPLDDAAGIERLHDCDYGPHAETAEAVASRHALLIHLGEGTGEAARNEFRCATSSTYDTIPLPGGGGTSQDFLLGNVTVLHGVAFDRPMLTALAHRRVDLVWSPRSNLSLYGRTLDIHSALALGITVALGTDWLPSGSMTLVREADCARRFAQASGHPLSRRLLWQMMTKNGAHAARMNGRIGILAPGAVADLILVESAKTMSDPYATVVSAAPSDFMMIVRGGRILAGDADLLAPLPTAGCEDMKIGLRRTRLCMKRDTGLSYASLSQKAAIAGLWPAAFSSHPPIEPSCVQSGGRDTKRDR